MRKTVLGRYVKCIGLLSALLTSSVFLSGCTEMMKHLGYTPTQAPVVNLCKTSNVLLTNLNKKTEHRRYMLPDGRLCLEVNNL